MTDHTLDHLIRTLDPAHRASPDPASSRAEQDLDRILTIDANADAWSSRDTRTSIEVASSPNRGAGADPSRIVTKRRTRRRLVLAAAAAAVIGVGVLVAPALTGGGDTAYATWTAVPTPLTPAEADAAAQSCRRARANDPGPNDFSQQIASAELALAERRGHFQFIVLQGPEHFRATCFVEGEDADFSESAGGAGTQVLPTPRRRDVIIASMSGNTTVSQLDGLVGPEVASVAYVSKGFGAVEATVSNGQFALWFPGDDFREPPRESEVKVGYADGTKRTLTLKVDGTALELEASTR